MRGVGPGAMPQAGMEVGRLARDEGTVGDGVARGGQSEKDFFAKLSIAYKEARETHYWLRLLKDTGYLTDARRLLSSP